MVAPDLRLSRSLRRWFRHRRANFQADTSWRKDDRHELKTNAIFQFVDLVGYRAGHAVFVDFATASGRDTMLYSPPTLNVAFSPEIAVRDGSASIFMTPASSIAFR